jgi:hypothetical protein
MKKIVILALLAGAMPLAAHALEPDEVRGEIVSTSPNADELTIRVTESGDAMSAAVGSTQTYDVPSDIEIEYEIERRTYAPLSAETVTLNDLEEGDSVLLRFDATGGTQRAVNIRNERTSNVEVSERIQREGRDITDTTDWGTTQMAANTDDGFDRDQLPSTASTLPTLFAGGMFLAFVATMLGLRRKRARQSL